MTAKEFLDLHFTEPDDLVNGDFRFIFERKLDEFAKIKKIELQDNILIELSTLNRFNQIKNRIYKLNLIK